MKMLFKRIMKFTNMDARFVIMTGIELLQCTHRFPVICSDDNTLAGRDLRCGLLRPACWCMRETFRIACL